MIFDTMLPTYVHLLQILLSSSWDVGTLPLDTENPTDDEAAPETRDQTILWISSVQVTNAFSKYEWKDLQLPCALLVKKKFKLILAISG